MEDYYKILGIGRKASALEIVWAYQLQAVIWHPYRNLDNVDEATKRFQDITEAFTVLSHPIKRSIYDRYGKRTIQKVSDIGAGGDAPPSDSILDRSPSPKNSTFDETSAAPPVSHGTTTSTAAKESGSTEPASNPQTTFATSFTLLKSGGSSSGTGGSLYSFIDTIDGRVEETRIRTENGVRTTEVFENGVIIYSKKFVYNPFASMGSTTSPSCSTTFDTPVSKHSFGSSGGAEVPQSSFDSTMSSGSAEFDSAVPQTTFGPTGGAAEMQFSFGSVAPSFSTTTATRVPFKTFNSAPPSGFTGFGSASASLFDLAGFGSASPSGLREFDSAPPSSFTGFGSTPISGFTGFGSTPPSGLTGFGSAPPSGFTGFGSTLVPKGGATSTTPSSAFVHKFFTTPPSCSTTGARVSTNSFGSTPPFNSIGFDSTISQTCYGLKNGAPVHLSTFNQTPSSCSTTTPEKMQTNCFSFGSTPPPSGSTPLLGAAFAHTFFGSAGEAPVPPAFSFGQPPPSPSTTGTFNFGSIPSVRTTTDGVPSNFFGATQQSSTFGSPTLDTTTVPQVSFLFGSRPSSATSIPQGRFGQTAPYHGPTGAFSFSTPPLALPNPTINAHIPSTFLFGQPQPKTWLFGQPEPKGSN